MNGVSSADPMVALAQLMLSSDELRAESEDAALRTARREQQQALSAEVDALKEAADKTRVGALVEGVTTGVGGMMSSAAYAVTPLEEDKPKGGAAVLLESGHALIGMAGPAGREFGQAPSMDAQADAKRAEQESADAGMRVEIANRAHDRVLDDQDRTIATLDTVLQSESQGNLAIIANV